MSLPSPTPGARFELRREIGRGGMGIVYEAFDRDREGLIALKTLTSLDSEARLRFKREFRALQGLHHPNLVRLGELLEHDGQLFFSMELIDGVDFYSWVRPLAPASELDEVSQLETVTPMSSRSIERTSTSDTLQGSEGPDTVVERGPAPPPAGRESLPPTYLDEERLRACLIQLARGLSGLHAANKIHCDVKPSNVLVTPTGHVVILDFGLIREGESATDGTVAGTVAFMAPEQAIPGAVVGPAADWYAVGVLLYFVLTRRLPFRGEREEIEAQKRTCHPPWPGELGIRVPRDLERLCMDLLS